ncbi:hypothetical protein GALMADRAFT_205266 [Galerina marginata CBS 339.88]|uniref:Uncharacterized protein n=1 Tax=Galerina marginata (strain CBS 339.88) TaxID=685588 RepID=A0A067U1A0_GALM3|nr:hypothetical protein GALMADRAFT_205266 [Galerina marginata CBS 339.88]
MNVWNTASSVCWGVGEAGAGAGVRVDVDVESDVEVGVAFDFEVDPDFEDDEMDKGVGVITPDNDDVSTEAEAGVGIGVPTSKLDPHFDDTGHKRSRDFASVILLPPPPPPTSPGNPREDEKKEGLDTWMDVGSRPRTRTRTRAGQRLQRRAGREEQSRTHSHSQKTTMSTTGAPDPTNEYLPADNSPSSSSAAEPECGYPAQDRSFSDASSSKRRRHGPLIKILQQHFYIASFPFSFAFSFIFVVHIARRQTRTRRPKPTSTAIQPNPPAPPTVTAGVVPVSKKLGIEFFTVTLMLALALTLEKSTGLNIDIDIEGFAVSAVAGAPGEPKAGGGSVEGYPSSILHHLPNPNPKTRPGAVPSSMLSSPFAADKGMLTPLSPADCSVTPIEQNQDRKRAGAEAEGQQRQVSDPIFVEKLVFANTVESAFSRLLHRRRINRARIRAGVIAARIQRRTGRVCVRVEGEAAGGSAQLQQEQAQAQDEDEDEDELELEGKDAEDDI